MISSPFELFSLPNVISAKLQGPVAVGDASICLGVSHSSITTLSLRPPQVLSAHSVAPGTIVTAVLAKNNSKEGGFMAYATKERSRYHIRLESGVEKEVDCEVAALYAEPMSNMVVAIYRNLSIAAFNLTDLTPVWSHREDGTTGDAAVVFSALVDDATAVIVIRVSGDKLRVRTVSFDKTAPRTLLDVSLDGKGIHQEDSRFSYRDGTLYCSSPKSKTITLYDLPDATLTLQFQLQETPNDVLALPNNNVVISAGNQVILVDCTYQAEVSRTELSGTAPVRLLTFAPSASAVVAVFDQSQVVGMTVRPTRGTLAESLGHSVSRTSKFQYGFTDIFTGSSTKDFRKTAQAQVTEAQGEAQHVLQQLEKAAGENDGTCFARVINYLKSPLLKWSATVPEYSDLVWEEQDREVDTNFMKELSKMVLKPCASSRYPDRLKLQPFVPEGVTLYLLSHPLFPTSEMTGLFRELSKYPRLHRQAVVSLHGVAVTDLVTALLNRNVDIFVDAVTRLVNDFGHQQIVQAVRTAFSSLRSLNALAPLVDRLSSHREALPLVAPFVDAIGLLGWDAKLLQKLQRRLQTEVNVLETLAVADGAAADLLRSAGFNVPASEIVAAVGGGDLKRKHRRRITAAGTIENKHIPRYSVETLDLP